MNEPPDDLELLVQEALTQLGWDADSKRIAQRVQRLNFGLPREDEFSIVCSWLGKCELIHKLDQKQIPQASVDEYQVPDLLAVFRDGERRIPVLVEVKSKKRETLSFRPDYYEKLGNYARVMKLPLLVAWKFHGLWTLFEFEHLQKARKNWNIRLDRALGENLLGVLAGDFSYSLYPGCGLHFVMRKDELLETVPQDQGYTEKWKMTCEDVYFTNGRREEVRDLPGDVQSLFVTWELEERESHSDTHITMSFVVSDHMQLFAHMALVRLLQFELPAGQAIDWRSLLHKSQIVRGVGDFEIAVKSAMECHIVRIVLHQQPRTKITFLRSPF